MGSPRFIEDLVLIERFKPQVVITSVGQPGEVVKRVHDYPRTVMRYQPGEEERHCRRTTNISLLAPDRQAAPWPIDFRLTLGHRFSSSGADRAIATRSRPDGDHGQWTGAGHADWIHSNPGRPSFSLDRLREVFGPAI